MYLNVELKIYVGEVSPRNLGQPSLYGLATCSSHARLLN